MSCCNCQTCIDHITNSAMSNDPWARQFGEHVKDGRVVHIGFKPDGRPIWRQEW